MRQSSLSLVQWPMLLSADQCTVSIWCCLMVCMSFCQKCKTRCHVHALEEALEFVRVPYACVSCSSSLLFEVRTLGSHDAASVSRIFILLLLCEARMALQRTAHTRHSFWHSVLPSHLLTYRILVCISLLPNFLQSLTHKG